MNAEIIAVGTELLIGQIANTNAVGISKRLGEVGVNVYYHSVVGDNAVRITEVFDIALRRSDLIIITGGLGPTQDDITKETIAEFLGLDLVIDEESENNIREYIRKTDRPFAENNLKQAYVPKGAQVLKNNNGTAPGIVIHHQKKIIILLPGPPKEMIPLFDDFIENHFKWFEEIIYSKFVKIFGMSESLVEQRIIDLIENQMNPTVATYFGNGEVTLRITAKAENQEKAMEMISPVIDEIKNRFGDYVYSTDGKKLEEVVAEMLKKANLKLSVAESCTGGMIATKLTSIAGASAVFESGVVTYSNQSKINMLGVKKGLLEEFGAVSPEVAKQMAEAARMNSNANIGVGVTGIAGPTGATETKPVGLVYIGLSDDKGTKVWEFKFPGNRDKVRLLSAMNALDLVRKSLAEKIK